MIVVLSGSGNALIPAARSIVSQGLGLTLGGLEHDVGHLFHVGHGHFAAAQPADEAQYRRPGCCCRCTWRNELPSPPRRSGSATELRSRDQLRRLLETPPGTWQLRTGQRPGIQRRRTNPTFLPSSRSSRATLPGSRRVHMPSRTTSASWSCIFEETDCRTCVRNVRLEIGRTLRESIAGDFP